MRCLARLFSVELPGPIWIPLPHLLRQHELACLLDQLRILLRYSDTDLICYLQAGLGRSPCVKHLLRKRLCMTAKRIEDRFRTSPDIQHDEPTTSPLRGDDSGYEEGIEAESIWYDTRHTSDAQSRWLLALTTSSQTPTPTPTSTPKATVVRNSRKELDLHEEGS